MTTKDEITAAVKTIFRDTVKLEPEKIDALTTGTHLRDDLELDSLDMIEVVYELEEKFDVQIPEERVKEIQTFGEIIDGLHEALTAS